MKTHGEHILISPSDPRWMEFIHTQPDASIFHHPAWSQLLTNCYGFRPFIIVLPNSDGTVAAGVPFMDITSLIKGRKWVSLPFSDYCSPLADSRLSYDDLLGKIESVAAENKVSALELRGVGQDVSNFHTYSEHVLHEAELDPNADAVMKRVHEMHRRNIKTALASNIQIIRGNTLLEIKEFYGLHLRTRRSQGAPVQPWKFFKELTSTLFDQGLGFVLLAYRNQQCIAGAVFLHWQNTLTYKYGASSDEGLKFRPNNLIMWSAMEWGCTNGFSRFDLGRSSLSNQGLRTFKSRWGARESPLWYASLAPRLDPGHFDGIMDLAGTIIQKSPVWVCRLTGELFYKHFG